MGEDVPLELPVQVSTHRYEEIGLKEFKVVIPQHLLAKLPEDVRFLVETVNKLEARFDWGAENIMRLNRDVLDLHKRVSALEQLGPVGTSKFIEAQEALNAKIATRLDTLWDWKQFLSGKWAIITGLALLVLGGLTKFLFDLVGHYLKIPSL
jgi:hypothetical protein